MARPGEEGRDLERGVVEEEQVLVLAVVPQALSVVRGHDQQGLLSQALGVEPGHEPPQLSVGIGDLAVVGALGKALSIGLGGQIRVVRVEEVHPRKKWPGRPAAEPGQGGVDHLPGRPLQPRVVGGRGLARTIGVVEAREPLVEARASGHGVGADERGGGVALLPEQRGQGWNLGREGSGKVVPDLVLVRVAAGEDRDVRRPSLGNLGYGVLEEHALAGQPVEGLRVARGVAVGSHVIGSEGVDGDEHQVGRGRRCRQCEKRRAQHHPRLTRSQWARSAGRKRKKPRGLWDPGAA